MLYFSKLRIVFITLFSLLFIAIASSNLFKIDDDFFVSKSSNSPLLGSNMKGKIKMTFFDGKLLFEDKE